MTETSSDKRVSGMIRVRWSISERDLGIDGIERRLTSEELLALYDHIEDALTRALHRTVYVQKPPVRVVFEVMGDDEIELDTGPLRALRARVAELERDLDACRVDHAEAYEQGRRDALREAIDLCQRTEAGDTNHDWREAAKCCRELIESLAAQAAEEASR